MQLEEQFELTRRDVSSRQQFLNQIDLEEASRFVNKVKYDPIQIVSESGKPALMSVKNLFTDLLMLNLINFLPFIKRDINVYPSAFNKNYLPTLNHFLNILIDHEGYHARDLYFNPFLMFDGRRMESDAYWNVIRQSEKRGLDDNWRVKLVRDYIHQVEIV